MRRQTSDGMDTCVNVYAQLNPWIAILIKHGTTTPVPASRQWIRHCSFIKKNFYRTKNWNILWFKAPSTLTGEILKSAFSLWKRITCFPSTLRQRNLKTQQSPVILDLYLRRTLQGKSHDYRFRNSPLSKCFPSTLKRKAGVFKFFQFEERFRKATLSWQLSVDGRPNRRNKAAF